MSAFHPKIVPYCRARGRIRDGDLLLFRRGPGLAHRLIASSGRSPYVHAALAAWWGEDLMCLEMLQFRDGRAVCLSGQVRRAPGCWDVYETDPGRRHRFDRAAAVRAMRRLTGTRYGWWNVVRVGLTRLPLLRWLIEPVTDDRANGAPAAGPGRKGPRTGAPSAPDPAAVPPMFCSQAVAWACRAGGVDPVPNLPDRLTEPGDLARSPLFRYRFTLVWDQPENKETRP